MVFQSKEDQSPNVCSLLCNQISHWLDGSNIYGSSLEESKKLRTFQDGLLNSQISLDGSELLPEGESEECTGEKCFKAGNFKF